MCIVKTFVSRSEDIKNNIAIFVFKKKNYVVLKEIIFKAYNVHCYNITFNFYFNNIYSCLFFSGM